MKRKTYILGLFILVLFLFVGCNDASKSKENSEKKEINMYDNLEISTEVYSIDEIQKIHAGINSWAQECLLVNNNMESDAVEKAEKQLYSCIDSEENLEAIKADHEQLYKNGTITISKVDTNIKEAKKAKYEDQNVGLVTCDIVITGQKNSEAFTRNYNMVLVIGFEKDEVTVYEVGEIAWKDA